MDTPGVSIIMYVLLVIALRIIIEVPKKLTTKLPHTVQFVFGHTVWITINCQHSILDKQIKFEEYPLPKSPSAVEGPADNLFLKEQLQGLC